MAFPRGNPQRELVVLILFSMWDKRYWGGWVLSGGVLAKGGGKMADETGNSSERRRFSPWTEREYPLKGREREGRQNFWGKMGSSPDGADRLDDFRMN